jgi:5,6,7,8-tetrahydromethanopterin hydro-lyase
MQVGEAFVGDGANAAHINTVLGSRESPFASAWAVALGTPREGHVPFLVAARHSVAACPPTVFVNKATVKDDTHANMTWGPAQAGVAKGIGRAVEDGTIAAGEVGQLLLMVAVWVNPAADDAQSVYENNVEATHRALRSGKAGGQDLTEFLEAARSPSNPFFTPA